jgi:hypothetical protein
MACCSIQTPRQQRANKETASHLELPRAVGAFGKKQQPGHGSDKPARAESAKAQDEKTTLNGLQATAWLQSDADALR